MRQLLQAQCCFHVSFCSPDPLSEASPARAQLELQVLPLSRGFLGGGKGEAVPCGDDPGSPFPGVGAHAGTVAALGKGAQGDRLQGGWQTLASVAWCGQGTLRMKNGDRKDSEL